MIGNDVVDLGEAETQEGAQHPGFDRRVFGESEQSEIAGAAEPRRVRWMLWAAKEAAYKAWRREDPAFVFSPRALTVSLFTSPAAGRRACGTVTSEAGTLAVRLDTDADAVEALATDPEIPPEALSLLAFAAPAGRDALRAAVACRLRREVVSRGLRGDVTLERRGRIPALRVGAQCFPVSISHHGRLARAAVLWQPGVPPRQRGTR